MNKGIEPINPKHPHAILGHGNKKDEREIVKEQDKTAGSQSCKALKPSPAKTNSCNPFHNRTQDRTKERENWLVLNLGISKDRAWTTKDPRVCLLNSYCAGKRPHTGWSTKLSILKKTHRDATLRLCQRSQLTLSPLNWLTLPTTLSSNNRWEVAADIQTEEQYTSTPSMNAQKHLATTATSPRTLIVFLKIPTLLKAEAAIALTFYSKANFDSTITPKIFNSETISTTVLSIT